MADERGVRRLEEQHEQVVSECRAKIEHWEKVRTDYSVLRDRLITLPDHLHYSVMVPLGPLAFMPGHLVKTNEVTVLLGDNWFTSLSARQAAGITEHRMQHVEETLDDLGRTLHSFEGRREFTSELRHLSTEPGNVKEIVEEIGERSERTKKGRRRVAHTPRLPTQSRGVATGHPDPRHEERDASEELSRIWAMLDTLEREEEEEEEMYRAEDTETATEQDEAADDADDDDVADDDDAAAADDDDDAGGDLARPDYHQPHHQLDEEEEEEAVGEGNAMPTIRFSHSAEPKKVRIDTGRNTTLKFSERREQQQQQQRRRRNSSGSSSSGGGGGGGGATLRSPADIYRWFADVPPGSRRPRKSILKLRGREDSTCSDDNSFPGEAGGASNRAGDAAAADNNIGESVVGATAGRHGPDVFLPARDDGDASDRPTGGVDAAGNVASAAEGGGEEADDAKEEEEEAARGRPATAFSGVVLEKAVAPLPTMHRAGGEGGGTLSADPHHDKRVSKFKASRVASR